MIASRSFRADDFYKIFTFSLAFLTAAAEAKKANRLLYCGLLRP
jgi:hypothetical protein